jgi:hypothetical protein
MPSPLNGITNATLTDLKIGMTDALKLQILFQKQAGNASQTLNMATFATNYATTDDKVSAAVKALEAAGAIKANYAAFTITWTANPTPSTTAAQLQADWNSKVLDDPTYYVYQALVLTKPAGSLVQNVDPATFASAPWNIPAATLIAEVQRLAARRPTTANPALTAPFSADFANVTLTWLTTNIGNAA